MTVNSIDIALATVMRPVRAGFSHGHRTVRLPVMGPPGEVGASDAQLAEAAMIAAAIRAGGAVTHSTHLFGE